MRIMGRRFHDAARIQPLEANLADSAETRTSFPEPPGIVRQATAEVAANILANVVVRQESLEETQEVDWVFNKKVREPLDAFRC